MLPHSILKPNPTILNEDELKRLQGLQQSILRQKAEADLVDKIEYLDYDQCRNSDCNDRVIIHKLEVIGYENSCRKC